MRNPFVLERKRQVVRLTSQGGAPWRITPPLGFKARILACLWEAPGALSYDQCILTASVGGDVFWQAAMPFIMGNAYGCFAIGLSYQPVICTQTNPSPGFNLYFESRPNQGLPDMWWEEQTVLIAVACDGHTITAASLVYELVPV